MDAVEFLCVLDQLAGDTAFVASEFFKGVGLEGPRAGLGDHGFGGVVVP